MIRESDREKIAHRAYELLRKLDPAMPIEAPRAFRDNLVSIVWDIERSVRGGQPSASPTEAALQQAIREYDVAPPPSHDEVLAAALAKEKK
jgi:hypothetical protein